MKLIKIAVMYFISITTGTLLATAAFIQIIYGNISLHTAILWQILLIGVTCTAVSMLAYLYKPMSKKEAVVRIAAHFILINLLVLGLGWLWEWFDITNALMTISMVIAIAAVYGTVLAISRAYYVRLAQQMNERLREYSDDE